MKSCILTDSSIKDRFEQEALARAAVKKKYCKGAKNKNQFLQVNLIKKGNEKIDDLLETPKTNETQEITADDFVLIQFPASTTKVLYVGQVEEKEAFTNKAKVMPRHGETSQLAFF